MNKQRLKEFLLDNVGDDRDIEALSAMVSQRNITDFSNGVLSKAYDEVLRLRNLKAVKYRMVADKKPEWNELSEYEKLVLLGKEKQKQYYEQYTKNVMTINHKYAGAYDLPETDRVLQLSKRKAELGRENALWHLKLNAEPEPKDWYFNGEVATPFSPKPKRKPKAGTKQAGKDIPTQPFWNKRKVINAAVGVGTLAVLANLMSGSGEQSNAQLYGQRPLY